MDRDKAREGLTAIADPALRMAETQRVEGHYFLELAAHSLYVGKKGKAPDKDVFSRIVDAMQTLIYTAGTGPNACQEYAARIEHAQRTLDAEFR